MSKFTEEAEIGILGWVANQCAKACKTLQTPHSLVVQIHTSDQLKKE